MANEKAVKPKKVKLDLIHDSARLVAIVRKECTTLQYDQRKIEERLNCRGDQAKTLINLAQIEDAKTESAKAAKA